MSTTTTLIFDSIAYTQRIDDASAFLRSSFFYSSKFNVRFWNTTLSCALYQASALYQEACKEYENLCLYGKKDGTYFTLILAELDSCLDSIESEIMILKIER